MSTYLYAPVIYPGTRELLDALDAKRLVKHDGMRFLHKGVPVEFRPKDVIICWGHHVPAVPGTITLNASYLYPNQMQVNLQMYRPIANNGLSIIPLEPMGRQEYNLGLDMYKNNGNVYVNPLKNGAWPRTVPYKDFPLHGSRFHASKLHSRLIIVDGALAIGKDASGIDLDCANKILGMLKLDFAAMYFIQLSHIPVIRKILTAVKLDADTAPVLAKSLLALAEKRKGA